MEEEREGGREEEEEGDRERKGVHTELILFDAVKAPFCALPTY